MPSDDPITSSVRRCTTRWARKHRISAAATWIAFGVLLIALFWSRLGGIHQSLWNDEAYSAVFFVRGGPKKILTHYIPNNHVLFSLLAWITTRAWGESELAYRLWAVGPACAAVVVAVLWLWHRQGAIAALICGVLLVVDLLVFDLSREARGYGLTLFAQAGLVATATRAVDEPRWSAFARYALFGVVGTLTLPVFGLGFAASSVVLLWLTRARLLGLVLAAGALLTAAVYSLVASQILASSTQEFGQPLRFWDPAVAPLEHLLGRAVSVLFFPGLGDAAVSSLIAALIVLGCLRLWRSGDVAIAWILLAPVAGSYALLAVLGLFVEERFQSFFAVNLAILAALGVDEGLRAARRWHWLHLALVGLLVWVSVPAARRFVGIVERAHELPRENFKDAATIAKSSGIARIVTNSVRPAGLLYYLPGRVQVLHGDRLTEALCSSERGVVFIEHPFAAPPADVGCLKEAGVVPRRVFQRERGEHIDVWVSPPRASGDVRSPAVGEEPN